MFLSDEEWRSSQNLDMTFEASAHCLFFTRSVVATTVVSRFIRMQ